MSQRVLYANSNDALKATKIGDPVKAIAAWMDRLPGSVHDGKTIKLIRHFQVDKRNALIWEVIVVVDVE
jgi:hypothetical protein